MPNVHLLPDHVISHIAAGEVIERPASVIKELLENAIDAQATTIDITLKDAGKNLIQIKDNGTGIEPDDLETIFLRHATSKIQESEDLFNIMSLGFRGEALYSIAAIADVVLNSTTQNQETGWSIHMRGGEQQDLAPHAMAGQGTEITIQELFFNMPARRKFLKTNTSELNQILNIIVPYTLLYPQIRFIVTHQGKELLNLSTTKDLTARTAKTLRLQQKHLLEVCKEYPEQETTIQLVLGDINITRYRRDMQFIFINGRPVQHKTMAFHLNEVYRLILPPGQFPFFAAFITMPPSELDVNIHPTKREVKIKNERGLSSLLRHLAEDTLMTAAQGKQATTPFKSPSMDNKLSATPITDSMSNGSISSDATIDRALKSTNSPARTYEASSVNYDHVIDQGVHERSVDTYAYPQARPKEFFIPDNDLFEQKQTSLQGKLKNAHYIGAFIHKYLLFEYEKSLLLVDQHAAAERITYEQLIQRMEKGAIETQHLLSPVLIKLSVGEMLIWEEVKEKLNELGLETTQWDPSTVAVHTHPLLIKDPEKAMRHLLAGESIARCDHDSIARRACRASIMTGDQLKPEQALHQRDQLLACLDPFTCPHGRPIVVEMNENFLDKQFLRS